MVDVKHLFSFSIDRGGTFTDIWFRDEKTGKTGTHKLLSECPDKYDNSAVEGIKQVLEMNHLSSNYYNFNGTEKIDPSVIKWVRMGTTVATNALLERKGEPTLLVTTKGFKDLLYIGNQARPDIFDLTVEKSKPIFEDVIEIDERILFKRKDCDLAKLDVAWRTKSVVTDSGMEYEVLKSVNEDAVFQLFMDFKKRSTINSVAVVLNHSYAFNEHELLVGKLAKKAGFANVSLSHQVMPRLGLVARAFTTVVDAYLTPCLHRYVESFQIGFATPLDARQLLFMQSDGGLVHVDRFIGSRAVVSGPAGGVVGFTSLYGIFTDRKPLIGFDMGGTSTDVARFDGTLDHVFETELAGVQISTPQLDIRTVAAGGGSRLFYVAGRPVVGPESAGAYPGPVCYRRPNAHLAVTDANVILGRIRSEYFKAVFGPDGQQPLDAVASRRVFEERLYKPHILVDRPDFTLEEAALGYVRVANETMARPIRNLTQAKGYDSKTHVLCCFGSAAGQHACDVAASLGISRAIVHRHAPILSAFGMALADVTHEELKPCGLALKENNFGVIMDCLESCRVTAMKALQSRCADADDGSAITTRAFLGLRFNGTNCALMVEALSGSGDKVDDYLHPFLEVYSREFGFVLDHKSRDIIVDDVRVRAVYQQSMSLQKVTFNDLDIDAIETWNQTECMVSGNRPDVDCYFSGGWRRTTVFCTDETPKCRDGAGASFALLSGPALLVGENTSIVVEPNCRALILVERDVARDVDVYSHVVLKIEAASNDIDDNNNNDNNSKRRTIVDPIMLSIFEHRFMSIAEQMGVTLGRTAISTNIKERLDYSCAVFDRDGALVCNAPHIPVHLGSMQHTVQCQLKAFAGQLYPGDALLSNAPSVGGTHLPDLTVIMPVFFGTDQKTPQMFVAARGHHADIGGIEPGSMPPTSQFLYQEGAIFERFKLVSAGSFDEEAVRKKLNEPGVKYPGECSGSRTMQDCLSDLRAQVASCHRGATLLAELVDYYGLDYVQDYMLFIQQNAERAVRGLLKDVAAAQKERGEVVVNDEEKGQKTTIVMLKSNDFMDCGAEIKLTVAIDVDDGSATFDFTGSSPQLTGSNLNAPRAVTMSAVIYCLRAQLSQPIPLNQGCLRPITIIIPAPDRSKGISCFLDPDETAAVVAGNVLTSQRLCDVILQTFDAAADSQGCMNNVTFGRDAAEANGANNDVNLNRAAFGYYETVAGGCGAGPSWSGADATHSHMTNTRITDPEILETRYPVVLVQFGLRSPSPPQVKTGESGENRGGRGVVRQLMFRSALHVSLLTERRVLRPNGRHGGAPGQRGINCLHRKKGSKQQGLKAGDYELLPSQCVREVNAGDELVLLTPSGGCWGRDDTPNGGIKGSVLEDGDNDEGPKLDEVCAHMYILTPNL